MTNFSKGDWVRYRANGFTQERVVLAVKPSGSLVTGQYENDPNPHTIDPDHRNVTRI